ncbi:MAG: MATE family efflux transporter, partial [Ruminococcaceae bacterium]|nr:MATE family efflux transporter [Oscillospiraceae bacterium]
MRNETNFTSGPIVGPLLRFSLPILLALFLQALYGAVDLLVVGKYAAASDVSGVAVGSQIMMTITNLISAFAMGTTILLGQKIGEGDRASGGRIIGTSIALFFAVGVALTALIPLLSGALAQAMNAPTEAFEETKRYISICGAGSIMIIAYNVLGSVMRGMGDSRTPLITVAIASACNITGDLLLIKGLGMGSAGAAIATVASQTVSVIVSFLLLKRRTLPFELTRRELRLNGGIARRITRFGAPIALQSLLVGLSFLVILAITNRLGLIASAGVGV